jgi:hypothetical protein
MIYYATKTQFYGVITVVACKILFLFRQATSQAL